MADYIMNNVWQVWAIAAVICLILELSSGDFFIICFSIGAVASAIGAAIGLNIYWQLAIFAAVALASIFFVRPIALRYLHKNEPNRPNNADALIGRIGRVTETIKTGDYGRVAIDGDVWKAVSNSATDITAGSTVKVTDRKSTIIQVESTTSINE